MELRVLRYFLAVAREENITRAAALLHVTQPTLSRHIRLFRERYPQVRFRIYSAIADDVKERIEKGLLDMGLLTEPVDIGRYAFHRLPEKDRWGVLVPEDHPLAAKGGAAPQDLLGEPLLLSGRELIRQELAGWFGEAYGAIQVAAEYNLILNAANMVKNGVGLALCFDLDCVASGLRFVPLSPTLETGTVLAWKKDQTGSPAAEEFLRQLRNADEAFLNEEKKYSTF